MVVSGWLLIVSRSLIVSRLRIIGVCRRVAYGISDRTRSVAVLIIVNLGRVLDDGMIVVMLVVIGIVVVVIVIAVISTAVTMIVSTISVTATMASIAIVAARVAVTATGMAATSIAVVAGCVSRRSYAENSHSKDGTKAH